MYVQVSGNYYGFVASGKDIKNITQLVEKSRCDNSCAIDEENRTVSGARRYSCTDVFKRGGF